MPKDIRRTMEPHDRLTRLCDTMISALESSPECGGEEKCIIFLQDGKLGGLVMHGYERDSEAMADLLIHLMAIFEANGKKLIVLPLGG
jgi:hypothetical protein